MASFRSIYKPHLFINEIRFSRFPSKGVGSPIRISLVDSLSWDISGSISDSRDDSGDRFRFSRTMGLGNGVSVITLVKSSGSGIGVVGLVLDDILAIDSRWDPQP